MKSFCFSDGTNYFNLSERTCCITCPKTGQIGSGWAPSSSPRGKCLPTSLPTCTILKARWKTARWSPFVREHRHTPTPHFLSELEKHRSAWGSWHGPWPGGALELFHVTRMCVCVTGRLFKHLECTHPILQWLRLDLLGWCRVFALCDITTFLETWCNMQLICLHIPVKLNNLTKW